MIARSGTTSFGLRDRFAARASSLTGVVVEREGERSTTGAWTDQAERALRVRTSAPTVEPDPGNAGGGRSMQQRRTLLVLERGPGWTTPGGLSTRTLS
jgi:hypothetical protein